MIKSLKRFFIPFVALMLAFTMVFTVACTPISDDNAPDGTTQTPDNETPDNETSDDENPENQTPDVTYDEGITAAGTYNESLYVVFEETNPANATVEYAAAGESNWTKVDAPLIRAASSTEARVDILGLAAGSYTVKITGSTGKTVQNSTPFNVSAYDRSGYAHFKYTDGVGAYEDDGTLKDGALVIYVTDQNKNDVLNYAYVDGEKVDISKYMVAATSAAGVTAGQQKGIGELLNNRRYSGNDRMGTGIAKLTQVYGAVAVRILGTVSAEVAGTMNSSINGLTDYDSTGNGGSVGDNGRMARITNAHDLTIEGVGDDACIFGWGVHFIANDENYKTSGVGKSFEVRNLTFENYPEDAVGMEGQQGNINNNGTVSGSSSPEADLYSPVERCWVHHNTFLPGYAQNPAESDKAEGDGSCDFKRGQYFTLAYNYFENCHKTNLLGANGKTIQYNITMHHNWWNGCAARQPLARRANIHFYNNYISGTSDTVSSMRAMSYMFSEANYYYTCSRPVEYKSEDGGTGIVKSFNDVFLNCYRDNSSSKVSAREEAVSNSCQFIARGIDYSSFDTNPNLFYYDAENKVSDCLLETAVEARKTVISTAGANGHGTSPAPDLNDYTPTSAVNVSADGDTVIALPTTKSDTTINGVMFTNLSGASSGTIKFKGQGITFTLAAEAEITVTGTANAADYNPELVRADGTVMAAKFNGTIRVVLPAGTYFITSGVGLLAGNNAKESTISELKFAGTSASSAERVQSAKNAINAIPSTAALTDAYYEKLSAARTAYNALTDKEKAEFDASIYTKLEAAENAYGLLLVNQFKTLVAAIGTVDKNSYDKLTAAQEAYDKLTSAQKNQVTAEKATLDAAWQTYEQFAVQNVIDMITSFVNKVNAIGSNVEKTEIEALVAEGDAIEAAYKKLSDDSENGPSQQAQVTNYAQFTVALAKLATYDSMFDFLEVLEYFKDGHTVTYADAEQVSALIEAYNGMTAEQQQALSAENKALYEKVLADFDEVKPSIIYCFFTRDSSKNPVINTTAEGEGMFSFIASCNGSDTGGTITTTDGKTVTVEKSLKLESKTQFGINLGSSQTATVKFYVSGSNGVKVNGTTYTLNNGIATVTGASGNLVIERAGGSDVILYIEVIFD